jgi:hypothetical protein
MTLARASALLAVPACVGSGLAAGAPPPPAADGGAQLSRTWLTTVGPRRTTTLRFRLGRPAALRVVIAELAPDCRAVASFRVGGRAGANRITLKPAHGRSALRAGTYRVSVRGAGGTLVAGPLALVVVEGAPTAASLAQARAANACRPAAAVAPGDPRPPSGLVALTLVAIACFGVASLPARVAPGPRAGAALAEHRPAVALAGAGALAAAVLGLLFA